MRISNSMISTQFLNNLNRNLEEMVGHQDSISSGKRINNLSDDPIGAISIMTSNVTLYRIEQYQDNIDSTQTWMDQTESSVLEMNELVKNAYESALQASNSYLSATEKTAIGELIGQIKDHVLGIGNAASSGKYIFGGYNTTKQPFTIDSGTGNILYNGVDMTNPADPALIAEGDQVIQYEIGHKVKVDVSVPGTDLMGTGDDNIYMILDELHQNLMTDAPVEDIEQSIDRLKQSQSRLMDLESMMGGRTARLEMVSNRYEEDFLNYTELKSQVEDVDIAEAITLYKQAESVYMAALQISASIIQPTLVEFIK